MMPVVRDLSKAGVAWKMEDEDGGWRSSPRQKICKQTRTNAEERALLQLSIFHPLSSILCRARPAAGAPKKRAQPLRAAPVKIQSGVILLGGCDLAFGFPIA
jgi:hypothetical protein